MSQKFIPFTLLLCIGVSLINTDTFGEPSYFAYFFYAFTACSLAVLVCVDVIFSQSFQFRVSLPVLFFLAMTFYILLHGVITNSFWLTHYYWVINAILLLSVSFWLSNNNNKILLPLLFKGLVFFAISESAIVMLQYAHVLPTANKFFAATGTWVNPNVTAMFLAIVFPIIIFRLVEVNGKSKKLYWLFFFLVTIALLLLKCRTAIIGAVVAAGIILNYRYALLEQVRTKYSGLKLAALVLFVFAALISTGYIFYKSKKESADGRKLVWKISTAMVAENPVSGYGYGNFEKAYNFSQADYFSKERGTDDEKANASFVRMAYNEYLQNAVEGGITGLILFALLLTVLLFGGSAKLLVNIKNAVMPEIAAYAGVAAFAVMSLFNFTVQAIPVMAIFIVYVSIVGNNCRQIVLPIAYSSIKKGVIVAFGVIVFFVASSQVTLANAYTTNKKISKLIHDGESKAAMIKLPALQNKLQLSDNYWITYGNALLQQQYIENAIDKFKSAISIKPYYQTYLLVGRCYQQIRNYDSAALYGNIARNHAPGRIKPKYFLMNLYAEVKDTANTLNTAKEIIYSKVKIQTDEVVGYKHDAVTLYKKFAKQ